MKETRTGRQWLQSQIDTAAAFNAWANQDKKPPAEEPPEFWQLPDSLQRKILRRERLEAAYKKREKLFRLKAKWFYFLADLITHGPEAVAFVMLCGMIGFASAAFLS